MLSGRRGDAEAAFLRVWRSGFLPRRSGNATGQGKTIPWYIMTSPANHAATVSFFRERSFFGLAEADVIFFRRA